MAEERNYIQFTSRIQSTTVDGVLMETDQAFDIAQNKSQKKINEEVKNGLAEVQNKINNSLTGLYRLMGTKANISEVLALTSAKKGDVWNVTADFNLNEKHYPAGTNVVAISDFNSGGNNAAKWDTLGGTVDLKGMVTLPKGEDGTLTYDKKSHTVKFNWTHHGNSSGSLVEQSSSATGIASQEEMTAALGDKVDKTAYEAKVNELNKAIGTKVESSTYLQKVDELEKKDGQLNTAIGLERKRIDKLEDGAVVTFSDFMLTVPEILQSSIPSGYEICYALNHDVFVARVGQAPSAKYYKTWPTADLYNKDNKSRADKFYLLCKNGVMRPYILFDDGEETRQLVPVKIGDSSGNNLEERIKALEDLLKIV